jgi:hypothetical protein
MSTERGRATALWSRHRASHTPLEAMPRVNMRVATACMQWCQRRIRRTPPAAICTAGTFSASGVGGASPCMPCVAGFLCSDAGTTPTTMVPCPYGYFCPTGVTVGTIHRCAANYFCSGGSVNGTEASCTVGVPLAAWFDADGDGDVDAVGSTTQGGMLLLRDSINAVSGDCNDAIARGLPAMALDSMLSVVYADVDGDGDDDVLGVTSSSNVVLLANNGSGFFVNATATSGLSVAVNCAVAVAVGDVDVFVSATSSASVLLQNDGSGGFTDVTAARVLPNVAGFFRVSTLFDVDGDGDLDLFAPLGTSNRLYINLGNGTMVESGSSRGVAAYSGGGTVREGQPPPTSMVTATSTCCCSASAPCRCTPTTAVGGSLW